ncbi:MAG: hypothetical protein ABIO60_03405 [Aquaticitalea sp.]
MKKILFITILCAFPSVFSQDYSFGKVSEKDLLETSNPLYPEANATVLYRNQNIYFQYQQGDGFVQKNEVYERLKIYNRDGFEYATKVIRLFVNREGSNTFDESISGLKALTYNLVGGKIVVDKLNKDGIFVEETNKFTKSTKFTMPDIKEGCIIEFEYTIISKNAAIDDIEFQQLIPINKLNFKLKTPEYFQYKTLMNPKATYIPKLYNSTGNDSFLLSRSSGENSSFPGVRGAGNSERSTSKIDYRTDIIQADLNNVPPLKNEEYVDNLSNYQAKLIMDLNMLRYPNEPTRELSTTWEKVTKIIYDNEYFGNQLQKNGYYEDDIMALLSGVTEPQQKADLIFNHVKSKVKWNGYNGYTTDDGVSKAYKLGTGNSAEINLMLVSILRYAGLDANPILVSTKNNGIPLLPTRSGFNYVICGLVIDNNTILLDATHKFSTDNILPIKSLNWLGRLIRKDQSSDWIPLTPTVPSKETVMLNIKLNPDLSANGKVRYQYTDYQAFRKRDKFENFSNEQMIESLEKDKGELEISNLEIENMSDVTRPIVQAYDYNMNNAMEEIGGKLYFTPLMFLVPKENPFKEEKRNYPIDFVFPIADKYTVNIVLPEGYTVETMPESTKFVFNVTEGAFTYIGRQNGSMLQFTISLDLNNALILASDYEQFKKFYQFMIEKQTEKVVLKKV